MKLISVLVCSAAAVAAPLAASPTAGATDVHCESYGGRDITIVAGKTACRADVGDSGQAHAAAVDGIGYAKATAGALALAAGVAGGIGASEGAAGLPIAIGLGPDAYAHTVLGAVPGPGRVGITLAFNGSQAQVTTEAAPVCLGSGAFAWDSRTGAACLATPFGLWHIPYRELP